MHAFLKWLKEQAAKNQDLQTQQMVRYTLMAAEKYAEYIHEQQH